MNTKYSLQEFFHKCTLAGLFLAIIQGSAVQAAIQFEEKTGGSGVAHVGESWGASWGDVNGDGFPDLFVNHHRDKPGLYVNNRNGTFTNNASSVPQWTTFHTGDQHGAAWADFDRDGDEDLFVSTGAASKEQFFVNEGGQLFFRPDQYGFTNSWAGMAVGWFDFNNDGELDVVYPMRGAGKTKIMKQDNNFFYEFTGATGIQCSNAYYVQFSDLNMDGRLELICATFNSPNRHIYNTNTLPFQDISWILPNVDPVNDSTIADFDNNKRPDVFHVRGAEKLTDAAKTGNNSLEAQLIMSGVAEKGYHFTSNGQVTFTIHWIQRQRSRIFIGAGGINPVGSTDPEEPILITLDVNDPSVYGIKPHASGTEKGLYIGYDTSSNQWQVYLSSGGGWNYAYIIMDTSATVDNVGVMGLWGSELPTKPAMLMNFPGGFQNLTNGSGFTQNIRCTSAAAGDFDNDMDIDLYLVCRRGVVNLANRLYENQGDGTFLEVANAGGAQGVVGTGLNAGETAVLADYDVDGFLDIFITNGQNYVPEQPYVRGGPDQLMRNLANTNKWIMIDLVGTLSNRSGIGAKVYATAGGKTQFREQDGGYHRYSQHHQRIHFGLAQNDTVDLLIEWPSGRTDNFNNVQANRVYYATEAGGIVERPLDGSTPPPPSGCDPVYDPATEGAVFVWEDCNGNFHVRATAGSDGYRQYLGTLTSDLSFSNITPFNLEPGDVLNTSDPDLISFDMGMSSPWEDGFDFILPSGANTCLTINTPTGVTVFASAARTPMTGPFDIRTLGACESVPPPSGCGAPSYDAGTDTGIFLWKDCDTGQWNTRAVAGSAGFSQYIGDVSSNMKFSNLTPIELEPNDSVYLPATNQISFNVQMGSPWEDGFNFTVPDSADTCFTLNTPTGATVYVGDTRIAMTDPFDIVTLASCSSVPPPSDVCGEPSYDAATDNAIFLWKNCSTGLWSLRAVAGNAGFAQYIGNLTSELGVSSITPFSLEGSDVLDTSNPNDISFNLQMWSPWEDGFDFTYPSDSDACLSLQSPIGASVLVGASRTAISTPFDLETLGACGN